MKKIIYLIISIILIILIFAIIIIINYKVTPPRYNYKTIRPYLKTGDIILFSCDYYNSTIANLAYDFRTKLVGSEFGHVGVIVRDPSGKLYLLECTDYIHTAQDIAKKFNDQGKGGLRMIDFDVLIKEYHKENNAVFAVVFIDREIPNSLILSKIDKYKNQIFEKRTVLLSLAFTDIVLSHDMAKRIIMYLKNRNGKKYNRMICSEFVYSILYDCGVVKKYPAKIFWPHFMSNGKLQKLSNGKYSLPIKFIYQGDL